MGRRKNNTIFKMKEYYNEEWKELMVEDDFGFVWRKVNYLNMLENHEPCWKEYSVKVPSSNSLGYTFIKHKYSDKVYNLLSSSGLDENYINCIVKEITDTAVNTVLEMKLTDLGVKKLS